MRNRLLFWNHPMNRIWVYSIFVLKPHDLAYYFFAYVPSMWRCTRRLWGWNVKIKFKANLSWYLVYPWCGLFSKPMCCLLMRVYRLIVKNEIMLPVAIFNLKWGAYGLGIEMLWARIAPLKVLRLPNRYYHSVCCSRRQFVCCYQTALICKYFCTALKIG